MNRLQCKDTRWKWTEDCAKAFQHIKDVLVSSTFVTHYNPSLPLRLVADASPYGLEAVISHVMEDRQEQPIAFASCTLFKSEQDYSQIEKEALALIFGVKKFHLYLCGRTFTLVTGHKPLTTIFRPKRGTPPLAAACLQHWSLILSAYSYNGEYCSTEAHANADSLSRLPLKSQEAPITSDEPAVFNVSQLESPVTSQQLKAATRTNPVLSKVIRYVQSGWPQDCTPTLRPYWSRRFELTIEGECLLWGI